jgi:hypothetical protein
MIGGICLAAGALVAVLPVSQFTLAWTHSIEKIRWEEDYRVVGTRLVLEEARIRGSGAGMEPPAGARLENGVWHYKPALPALEKLRITQSPYAAGYEICAEGACRRLATVMPGLPPIGVVELRPCAPTR